MAVGARPVSQLRQLKGKIEMADIVDFRRRQAPQTDVSQDKWKIDQHRRRRELLKRVRTAEWFQPAHDVIWPAQAIDRLMTKLRERGKSTEEIKRALKAEGRWHSERLRIDHKKSPSDARAELDRRAGTTDSLSKKVQQYVSVLEALAQVSNERADDNIYAAFENTSFRHVKDAPSYEPIDDLLWLLEETATAVIQRENLKQFFETARTLFAEYDPVTEDMVPSVAPALVNLYLESDAGGFLNNANPVWDRWPAFPSVPLLRIHRSTIKDQILVEQTVVAPAERSLAEVAQIVSPMRTETWRTSPRTLGGFRPVGAHVDMYSDTRLVIGPRHRDSDLGMMFECGTFIRLKINDRDRPLTFPYAIDPISAMDCLYGTTLDGCGIGLVAARFDDGWHRISSFGKGLEKPEIELIDGTKNCESRLTWLPLDIQTLTSFVVQVRSGEYLLQNKGPLPPAKEIWLHSCPEFQNSVQTGALAEAFSRSCQRLRAKLTTRSSQSSAIREQELSSYLAWLGPWQESCRPKGA
jgi:hypothetical protein